MDIRARFPVLGGVATCIDRGRQLQRHGLVAYLLVLMHQPLMPWQKKAQALLCVVHTEQTFCPFP